MLAGNIYNNRVCPSRLLATCPHVECDGGGVVENCAHSNERANVGRVSDVVCLNRSGEQSVLEGKCACAPRTVAVHFRSPLCPHFGRPRNRCAYLAFVRICSRACALEKCDDITSPVPVPWTSFWPTDAAAGSGPSRRDDEQIERDRQTCAPRFLIRLTDGRIAHVDTPRLDATRLGDLRPLALVGIMLWKGNSGTLPCALTRRRRSSVRQHSDEYNIIAMVYTVPRGRWILCPFYGYLCFNCN